MGAQLRDNIDAWLRDGGIVVASSDRAARALQATFHRKRRSEGLAAWPAPKIVSWNTFARAAWEDRNLDGRLLINSAQELSVWCEIIHSERHLPTALSASVRRLAVMAVEACDLLGAYAPRFFRHSARVRWDHDAGQFSNWLSEFDEHCVMHRLVPLSRVPAELLSLLQDESSARPPLRLAGFDHLLPLQRQVFDAWGHWEQFPVPAAEFNSSFHSAPDTQTELEACASWCHAGLAAEPLTRILVITQEASRRRGEIERAFLRFFAPDPPLPFEFSLGIPLSNVAPVRAALLLLSWLGAALGENELDWLFASNLAATHEESSALRSSMRTLRRRDRQRLQWPLASFFNQNPIAATLPTQWKRRMTIAQRKLEESSKMLNPLEWADKVPQLLETIGWPGADSKTSVQFQEMRRWQQALDTAGSLGFDGRRISWQEFLADLEHTAADILFTPQSSDAPIQIVGPAESAGLSADAVWFLGADEDTWPGVASMHPFLPAKVQREFEMPHSSHDLDWRFSSAITNRLLSSAQEVHFSYATQVEGVETGPSRLIQQLVCAPQPLAANQYPPVHEPQVAAPFIDSTTVGFHLNQLSGGAGVLSWQSQCPFKAFASARLDAKDWDAAEFGLSAKQRGQILHAVLHSLWSGKPPGIKSQNDLIAIKDLVAFVETHVNAGMQSALPHEIFAQVPPSYLELEKIRLDRLIHEWIDFEKSRAPFEVQQVEAERTVTIAGLSMKLRLDRVDRLIDGSPLVIDYKTGNVNPRSWDLPRPDDLQLPLYKVFGLEPLQPSLFDNYAGPARGGLVFARVRTGDICLTGRITDAKGLVKLDLPGNSSLVRRKLTGFEELQWKEYIQQMAEDFLHGRAEVNPREFPKTCERCGLQAVCRVQEPENHGSAEDERDDDVVEG
jgi:ATP-dependent helicase/nuclease subunit B